MKKMLAVLVAFALCFAVSCGGSEEPAPPVKAEEPKKEEPKVEPKAEPKAPEKAEEPKAEEKKDQ